MTEKHAELSKRLVVGHKRDGRSCYDKEAKRELIEACLQPGVSIARMGLQHGINANLLRTWITRHRRQRELVVGRPASEMGRLPSDPRSCRWLRVEFRRRLVKSDSARSYPTGSSWI